MMSGGGQTQGQGGNMAGVSSPYANMFNGAAQNYGSPSQSGFSPFFQMAQQQNRFQSPFQQPNYNYQPAPLASTSVQPNSSQQPTALAQQQINTVAGLPSSGQPIPAATAVAQQALSSPSSTPNVPAAVPATGMAPGYNPASYAALAARNPVMAQTYKQRFTLK